MPISRRLFALLLLAAPLAFAEPPKPQQFVYLLKVAPSMQDPQKWGDKEKAAAGAHFQRLQKATAEGMVVHAGRSTESLDKTFGIVVFEAADEAAAKKFAQEDPAVQAGLMTATVHPYTVVLQRK
jgi:uncharacterized protein YciI